MKIRTFLESKDELCSVSRSAESGMANRSETELIDVGELVLVGLRLRIEVGWNFTCGPGNLEMFGS